VIGEGFLGVGVRATPRSDDPPLVVIAEVVHRVAPVGIPILIGIVMPGDPLVQPVAPAARNLLCLFITFHFARRFDRRNKFQSRSANHCIPFNARQMTYLI
jgi:hypothetical protein